MQLNHITGTAYQVR